MRQGTPHVEPDSSFYWHIVIKREAQGEFIATESGRESLKRIGFVDCSLCRTVQRPIARYADDVAIEDVAVFLDHEVDHDSSPLAKLRSSRNQPVASHA